VRTLAAPVLAALASGSVALVQLVKLAFSTVPVYLNSSTWDLVWQRRYNLLTYSEQFDQWGLSAATVTPNSVANPLDGAVTADTLNFTASSGSRAENSYALTPANGSTYTFSVWLKGTGTMAITVNTSTGIGGASEPTISLTGTWTRYIVSCTFSGATGSLRGMVIWRSGHTATSVQVWGAQLEPGELASAYTPTTTTALTDPGITYKGAYGLGQISAITDKPGEVQGITLELHGSDASRISLALDDADIVQGTAVEIRTAIIDTSTYQILDAPVEWVGYLDTMAIAEDGTSASISCTAESRAVDLLRGNAWMYTDADQRLVNAADGSFKYVVDQVDKPIVWPAREFFYQ
jgi:hypothetical protein